MATGWTDCDDCGSTTRSEDATNGLCPACLSLGDPHAETVEVPVKVLEKLVGMANTRHPTVAAEDAPRYRNILRREGLLPEDDG